MPSLHNMAQNPSNKFGNVDIEKAYTQHHVQDHRKFSIDTDTTDSASSSSTTQGPDRLHESIHDHPSSKMWSVYVAQAAIHDKALVESWKGDMEGILIFAGLFSASVTAFIIESYTTLQADPNDTMVSLLTQISAQLANSSQADTSFTPSAFRPTSSAMRVNAFWFLSLCFGLSCALFATLVQQWARNYLHAIELRSAPHKRARIRAFLYEGITSFGMTTVVEAIPALLHISVFLFFAGLVEFLFAINQTIAYMVLAILIIWAMLYVTISLLPTIQRHCPYQTPFTAICWRLLQMLHILRYRDASGNIQRMQVNIAEGQELIATQKSPSRYEQDSRALSWIMSSLTEDSEIEPFLEGIHIYLSSRSLHAIAHLVMHEDGGLIRRTTRLLMTCERPGGLAIEARQRRTLTCTNAICSLVKAIRDTESAGHLTFLNFFTADLGRTLKTLRQDKSHTIRGAVNSAIDVVAFELQIRLIDIAERPKYWRGRILDAMATAFRFLDELEALGPALDAVLEMIPNLTRMVSVQNTDNEDAIRVRRFVLDLQSRYFPNALSACNHPIPSLPSAIPTQRRAASCLRAIYSTTSIAACHHLELLRLVKTFCSHPTPSLSHWAWCTTTRIACLLQSEVVHSTWNSCAIAISAIDSLDTMDFMLDICSDFDGPTQTDLRQQLRLSLDLSQLELWGTNILDLSNCLEEDAGNLWRSVAGLSAEELRRLQGLQLTKGRKFDAADDLGKVLLARGQIVILILFLNSLYTVTVPSDQYWLTLDTLHFITTNLTARFSSQRVQTLLVDVIASIVERMHDEMHSLTHAYSRRDHKGVAQDILGVLFGVLCTVGDPQLLGRTRSIIEEYMQSEPSCDAAVNALRKLDQKASLTPLD